MDSFVILLPKVISATEIILLDLLNSLVYKALICRIVLYLYEQILLLVNSMFKNSNILTYKLF